MFEKWGSLDFLEIDIFFIFWILTHTLLLRPIYPNSLSLQYPLLLIILPLLSMPLLQRNLLLHLPFFIHSLDLFILLQYKLILYLLHLSLSPLSDLLLLPQFLLLLGLPLRLQLLHLCLLFYLLPNSLSLCLLEFSDPTINLLLRLFALLSNSFVHFALELCLSLLFFFAEFSK